MKGVEKYKFSTLLDLPYEEAVDRTKHALREEGFGVLTEIDVKATLKDKLDLDFRNYVILGACNPPFAHRALETDLDVGLLLPCNVIVYESDTRKTTVAALNPMSGLEVIQNNELNQIAEEISAKLKRVIQKTAERGSNRLSS